MRAAPAPVPARKKYMKSLVTIRATHSLPIVLYRLRWTKQPTMSQHRREAPDLIIAARVSVLQCMGNAREDSLGEAACREARQVTRDGR